MERYQIVIDTNVLVAALQSSRGASHRLFLLINSGSFEMNVSAPLVLEYEAVAKRLIGQIPLTDHDIDDILDYICAVANRKQVYYLWRPFLKDARDDMILELAVAADCDFIVTHNKKDFEGVEHFGLEVVTPKEFLEKLGELP